MDKRISVVIPVYNAADSLRELYQRLASTLQKITDDFEVIMVDDNSQDESYQQILRLHKKDNRIKGIKLAKNFGQQNALICGFNYTTGDYVVTIDDDLQHSPEDIIKLYNTIIEGYEVVYAIPVNRKHRFYRRIGSKLTDLLLSWITSKGREIKVSSFRIMTGELVEKITDHQTAFVYISAIILQYTNNINNIFVSHNNRKYGSSNYNFIKSVRLFLKLFIYYSDLSLVKLLRAKKPQYRIEQKIGF